MSASPVTYRLRHGFSIPADPAVVGPHLERLKRANGDLHPADVIAAAAKPKSPLHPCFEWDDTEAARQHRLEQARYLIRSIEVEYERVDPAPAQVVSVQYVNLGGRRAKEPYRDLRDVLADRDSRARYVQSVLRELRAIREKHRHIQELADVYAAIDQAARLLMP